MIKKILVIYHLNKFLNSLDKDIKDNKIKFTRDNVSYILDDLRKLKNVVGESFLLKYFYKKIQRIRDNILTKALED